MINDRYELTIIGSQEWDPLNDNIDVEVEFADGRRFAATFFTVRNIESLFQKNRATGECCGGTYLWASGMIIADDLERETLAEVVDGLLRNGEFSKAFSYLGSE